MTTALKTITTYVDKYGVTEQTAELLVSKFAPFNVEAQEWLEKAHQIKVTDASQKVDMANAHVARIALQDIRLAADKTRALLKKDALSFGNAVQALYNELEKGIKPAEAYLLEQEKFAEVQEAKQREEDRLRRLKALEQYSAFVPDHIDLGAMGEEDFQRLYNGAKLQFEARQKEEDEQRERERIDKLHRERHRFLTDFWQFVPDEVKEENFGELGDNQWKTLLDAVNERKSEHEAKVAEEKRQQEEQRLRIEAQEKELARQRKKAEQAALDRVRAEQAVKEAQLNAKEEARKRAEAEEARQRAEADAADQKAKQDALLKQQAAEQKKADAAERNAKRPYSFFNNETAEFPFTVQHDGEEGKTFIALTDDAEKADFITQALNQFSY